MNVNFVLSESPTIQQKSNFHVLWQCTALIHTDMTDLSVHNPDNPEVLIIGGYRSTQVRNINQPEASSTLLTESFERKKYTW